MPSFDILVVVVAWSKKSFLGPAVFASFVFHVLFKDE